MPSFFYQHGTVCNVHEDEAGPILFVRGTKALRIDIQFIDNRNYKRNREALAQGFPSFVERARAAGFTELIFCSDSPHLRRYCKRAFGFVESAGELRKVI